MSSSCSFFDEFTEEDEEKQHIFELFLCTIIRLFDFVKSWCHFKALLASIVVTDSVPFREAEKRESMIILITSE